MCFVRFPIGLMCMSPSDKSSIAADSCMSASVNAILQYPYWSIAAHLWTVSFSIYSYYKA